MLKDLITTIRQWFRHSDAKSMVNENDDACSSDAFLGAEASVVHVLKDAETSNKPSAKVNWGC